MAAGRETCSVSEPVFGWRALPDRRGVRSVFTGDGADEATLRPPLVAGTTPAPDSCGGPGAGTESSSMTDSRTSDFTA